MEGRDQITLVAAGMAAHQHLAALARIDDKPFEPVEGSLSIGAQS